jgi:Ca2+-binding RTX toxin-like protein
VKNINGTQTMLASYWDSGYVTLNVSNPAAPAYIGDSDFGASDPLTGFSPPEGNGHQAEFSHDNKYILAADEDFDQYRFQAELKDGPNAGFQFHEAGGADKGTFITPENPVEDEDSRFVGDACTASGPLAAPSPGVTIAVVERGTCTFQEKAQNADDAGYDTILIFNNRGTDGQRCDVLLGMTLGTYSGDILALFVARSVGMRIIGAYDPATYSCDGTAGTGTPAPAAPQEGATLDIAVLFDGWGYSHLYRNQAGKLPKLGDYAINEGVDPRWAERFGDLSIHEFAADPATNLAYISYYSGGFRVVRYGESGIEQVGAFVDQRPDGKGNDFWGVEQFTAANGERLIATSDRDYGLYIFRYTGPGAIGPTPVKPGLLPGRCTNALVGTAGGEKIVGTAAGDIITGYAGDDEIEGAGGDDCINGLEGNDLLRGGSGVDTVDGHKGNDRVYGGSGRGTLRGGTGRDRLFGSTLRDTLFGNTGADRLAGGRGADQLFGGAGPDRIVGGRGRDTIEGGTGNDRIYAKDGRRDFIDCGFGNDRVVTRDAVDRTTSCERRG